MRTVKLIFGIVCFLAALLPGLLVLGELNFSYFNLPLAVCTAALVGAGWFLVTKRNAPISRTAKVLLIPILCLLAGFVVVIVIPNFIRASLQTAANGCINNLRQIDAAAQQFALEKAKKAGDAINYPNDLTPYIKLDSNGSPPKCQAGGTYTISRVGEDPKCSIGTTAWPNSHVLPGNETNSWWTDFKAAYSIVLSLHHPLPHAAERR